VLCNREHGLRPLGPGHALGLLLPEM
jgi:hypothetical protein